MTMTETPSGEAPLGFQTFARMVHDTIGVCIPETKRGMIEARLGARVRALGLRDAQDYFRHLFAEGGLRGEMAHIEETVTTNKTDFFREVDHFNYVKDVILDGGYWRNRNGKFKAWSAAASTGAEPFSLAMLLAEHSIAHPDFDWAVLGTDISGRVLEHARRAIYSSNLVEPVPEALRNRYLHEGQNEWAGKSRIVPALRKRVQFKKLNLMSQDYDVDFDLDIVFLRNVLIYFDPDDQLTVLRKVGRHLAPGGHLFVGNSESMIVRMPYFRQVAPAIYRKDI
jgi:chemotaxis protein methyltransferase CheR